MLEWAFKNENKTRVKLIERELKRVKQSKKEIISISKNAEKWKDMKNKLLAVVKLSDFSDTLNQQSDSDEEFKKGYKPLK